MPNLSESSDALGIRLSIPQVFHFAERQYHGRCEWSKPGVLRITVPQSHLGSLEAQGPYLSPELLLRPP